MGARNVHAHLYCLLAFLATWVEDVCVVPFGEDARRVEVEGVGESVFPPFLDFLRVLSVSESGTLPVSEAVGEVGLGSTLAAGRFAPRWSRRDSGEAERLEN